LVPDHPEASGFHRSVDLPAPEGSPVWATAAGTVLRVQNRWPGGLEVLIKHTGFISIYSHLASVSNRIIAGQTPVTAGELVGYVGHTGLTFGPHLYFAIVYDGFPIDPAPVFGLPHCAGQTSIVQAQR
jgi:murein DD-endopeptidase MepM/ murein hydrolase activator NlpD